MSFDCLATLMTPFIDSHCHLTDPAFAQDLDAVIGRMKNAGMTAAVTIGCEDRDIEPLRALLDRYPGFLFGAWAVHPEYPDAREADADEIAERASEPGMVAVGETGLDFYWCKEPLDWQRDRFRRHIEAARRAQNRLSSMPAMQKPRRSTFSKAKMPAKSALSCTASAEHLKPLEALSMRADMSVLRGTLLSRRMPNCAPLPQPFRLKNS